MAPGWCLCAQGQPCCEHFSTQRGHSHEAPGGGRGGSLGWGWGSSPWEIAGPVMSTKSQQSVNREVKASSAGLVTRASRSPCLNMQNHGELRRTCRLSGAELAAKLACPGWWTRSLEVPPLWTGVSGGPLET